MGRQVNFFIMQKDEDEFVRFVLSQPGVEMLGHLSLTKKVPVLSALPIEDSPLLPSRQIFFHRQGTPVYTTSVVVQVGPLAGKLIQFLDVSASPVIEFSRSMLHPDGTLGQGRIWADMRRLEGDHFVLKGDEFEQWYETLARWIRKRWGRLERGSFYRLSDNARVWCESGGKLGPR